MCRQVAGRRVVCSEKYRQSEMIMNSAAEEDKCVCAKGAGSSR